MKQKKKLNWTLLYKIIMEDFILVPIIAIAWGMELFIMYPLPGLFNIPMVILILVVFYGGVRTEQLFRKYDKIKIFKNDKKAR